LFSLQSRLIAIIASPSQPIFSGAVSISEIKPMRFVLLNSALCLCAATVITLGEQGGITSYEKLISAEPGRIAWWRFEGDLVDQLNALPAAPAAGAAVFEAGPRGGKALSLVDSRFVAVGPSPSLDLPEMTIEMGFRPDFAPGLGYNPCLIAKRKDPAARFSIHLFQDYSVLAVWNGGQVIVFEPILNRLRKGQWHHLAVTCSADQLDLYLDGNPCYPAGEKGTFNFHAAGLPLQIGSSSPDGAELFQGAIDEVVVYSRVLSAADIARRADAMGLRPRVPAEQVNAEIARRNDAVRQAEENRRREEKKRLATRLADDRLFDPGDQRVYKGERLGAIRLPLGGIGTGSIQIDGTAARPIWQIFNNFTQVAVPNSFFAVRCGRPDSPVCVRALQTVPVGPFPAVKSLSFRGEYPFGWFTFEDPDLPVDVTLEAFNPLVPFDPRRSGIPCAIFNLTARNTTDKTLDVSFLATQQNAVGYTGQEEIKNRSNPAYGGNINRLSRLKGSSMIRMTSNKPADSFGFGDMTLAVNDESASACASWESFDALLDDWSADGSLATTSEAGPSSDGATVDAAIASRFELKPGESRTVSFILTWFFPNAAHGYQQWGGRGNMYANWWASSLDVAHEVLADMPDLAAATRLYHDTFYASNLPRWLLDRISSQVVVLRSPTCFWTRTGYFGGWEGCCSDRGCCKGNCSHVWHYAQAHARLFPQIARRMRDQEFHFQQPDGGVPHRQPTAFIAFDGQCGTILGAYREHLVSPDRSWLSAQWPAIRLAMDYTISQWDKDEDGLLTGPQWNTLDERLGGTSSWLGSLYLAALAAAEKMAIIEVDDEPAERYRRIREVGRRNQDKGLFNGQYYIQIPDTQPLRDYNHGCHIDQLLGQWWARQLDIEDLYPPARMRSALRSLLTHNFRTSFVGVKQVPRKFVSDHDAGMQMIVWPDGKRPANHMLYADEVMTGFEYAAAAEMIYEGMLREGLTIVKAASDRYDGRLRRDVTASDKASWGFTGNPFGDDECGKFYARAMSSWSLLLACQGFIYDGPAGIIGFQPRYRPEDHRSFFSAAEGYGLFSQQHTEKTQSDRIEIRSGTLKIRALVFALPPDAEKPRITLHDGRRELSFEVDRRDGLIQLRLDAPLVLSVGHALVAGFTW